MSGVGEILGGLALIEPIVQACFKSYGFYKLTRDFGEDYQKAERCLRGQKARLKLLADTRIDCLLSIPEDGTVLSATVIATLQGMRISFEKCESLMKRYGEVSPQYKDDTGSLSIARSPPEASSNALSPVLHERKSRGLSFRRHKSSLDSSSPSRSTATSDTNETSTVPSSVSSLYSPKVTNALQDQMESASALQRSSRLWGRMKWASEDRKEFFRSVESLTKDNDLLESVLRIKAPSDQAFLANFASAPRSEIAFISSVKKSLRELHQELLAMNSPAKDLDFSLKLSVHEEDDKNEYIDYIDSLFDQHSLVHLLQAHSKLRHAGTDESLFLLAENATLLHSLLDEPSRSLNLIDDLHTHDPDADPPFQILKNSLTNARPKIKIFQDRTSIWKKTDTLENALDKHRLQDTCFRQSYTQLSLLAAFSYAVLPFTYIGKNSFPQASNFVYYDQATADDSPIAKSLSAAESCVTADPLSATQSSLAASPSSATTSLSAAESSPATNSPLAPLITIEDSEYSGDLASFPEDLLSPWYNFNFGCRPAFRTTKAFGKKPGITSVTNNPLVALGILLYQIGSWRRLPAGDTAQMRRDAISNSHELVRLSGVEFAEITRTCLNWKEAGSDGTRYDCEEMLVKIYSKLSAYNQRIQQLI